MRFISQLCDFSYFFEPRCFIHGMGTMVILLLWDVVGIQRKEVCAVLCCAVLCLVPQSCPTLCDCMDCSLPGSSDHGDSPGKNTGVGCHVLLERRYIKCLT